MSMDRRSYTPVQQYHQHQSRPTLPPLATQVVPSGLPSVAPNSAYHHSAQATHTSSSYHTALPSLSQVLSPSTPAGYPASPATGHYGNSSSSHHYGSASSASTTSYAHSHSPSHSPPTPNGYALEVARHVPSHARMTPAHGQHPSISGIPAHMQHPSRPQSTPPPLARYGSPGPSSAYGSASPPGSPTLSNGSAARPYVCPETSCAASFSRPHDLKRHVQSVHRREGDMPPPQCGSCGRYFSRGDALKRHIARGCQLGDDPL